jgi:hypothetical protein
LTSKSRDIINKLFENNEEFKIIKLQAAMRSYLAAKEANAAKYGSYEFKDFNDEDTGDYTNDFVENTMKKLGAYKYDKSVNHKYDNKKRSFRGMEVQANGARYQGEKDEDGLRHGMGTMVWKDGSRYDGYWMNDMANGYGRMIMAKGDVYSGNWVNNRANGQGKFIHRNRIEYDGEWQNDLPHGHGTEIFLENGAQYSGQFRLGKKHGFGKYTWADGSSYEGDFNNNIIGGKGRYEWSDGRIFEGDWLGGSMHGYGIFTWPDGRRYEGEYQNDSKHGNGTFYWQDGRKYEGQWSEGKQHGRGVYTSSEGEKKEGIWRDGARERWLDE